MGTARELGFVGLFTDTPSFLYSLVQAASPRPRRLWWMREAEASEYEHRLGKGTG